MNLRHEELFFLYLYTYIDKLLREHRIATATHYQTAYNTFARFRGNNQIAALVEQEFSAGTLERYQISYRHT